MAEEDYASPGYRRRDRTPAHPRPKIAGAAPHRAGAAASAARRGPDAAKCPASIVSAFSPAFTPHGYSAANAFPCSPAFAAATTSPTVTPNRHGLPAQSLTTPPAASITGPSAAQSQGFRLHSATTS